MLKGWKEKTIGVLCTFYPYGLNDNLRKVGNISKYKDKIVVNTLFHKQTRKFRKRQLRKRGRKIEVTNLTRQSNTAHPRQSENLSCLDWDSNPLLIVCIAHVCICISEKQYVK